MLYFQGDSQSVNQLIGEKDDDDVEQNQDKRAMLSDTPHVRLLLCLSFLFILFILHLSFLFY